MTMASIVVNDLCLMILFPPNISANNLKAFISIEQIVQCGERPMRRPTALGICKRLLRITPTGGSGNFPQGITK
jgi:hypothetical protein